MNYATYIRFSADSMLTTEEKVCSKHAFRQWLLLRKWSHPMPRYTSRKYDIVIVKKILLIESMFSAFVDIDPVLAT